MVQILPQSPSFSQSFGKNLSEGFSEKFDDNLKRGALASGLKNIRENTQNMSPLDQLSQLMNIYGMTPDLAAKLEPYLQAERNRKLRDQLSQGFQGSQQLKQPMQAPLQNENNGQMVSNPQEGTQLEGSYFGMDRSDKKLYENAKNLSIEAGVDVDTALAHLKLDEPKKVEREKEYLKQYKENLNSLLNTNADASTRTKLGSLVSSNFEDRLKSLASEKELSVGDIKNLAMQSYRFAKSRNNLAGMGRDYIQKIFSPRTAKRKTDAIIDSYRKSDSLEQAVDDLVTFQKLSTPMASNLVFPPSQETKKIISSLKNNSNTLSPSINDPKVFDKVSKSLSDSDSLLAIAFQISKKGYNPSLFLEYVQKANNGNNLRLTPRQISELTNIKSQIVEFNPTIGDSFSEAMLNY